MNELLCTDCTRLFEMGVDPFEDMEGLDLAAPDFVPAGGVMEHQLYDESVVAPSFVRRG